MVIKNATIVWGLSFNVGGDIDSLITKAIEVGNTPGPKNPLWIICDSVAIEIYVGDTREKIKSRFESKIKGLRR